MKTHDNSVVDLGDARIETRGKGVLGPLDVQTFGRTYDAGIQADDCATVACGARCAPRHWRGLHVILSYS